MKAKAKQIIELFPDWAFPPALPRGQSRDQRLRESLVVASVVPFTLSDDDWARVEQASDQASGTVLW